MHKTIEIMDSPSSSLTAVTLAGVLRVWREETNRILNQFEEAANPTSSIAELFQGDMTTTWKRLTECLHALGRHALCLDALLHSLVSWMESSKSPHKTFVFIYTMSNILGPLNATYLPEHHFMRVKNMCFSLYERDTKRETEAEAAMSEELRLVAARVLGWLSVQQFQVISSLLVKGISAVKSRVDAIPFAKALMFLHMDDVRSSKRRMDMSTMYLESLKEEFYSSKKLELKHALCRSLVNSLSPCAPVLSPSVTWNSVLLGYYAKAEQWAKKAKHHHAVYPFLASLLGCMGKNEFLERIEAYWDNVGKLLRDARTKTVALECMVHTLGTYFHVAEEEVTESQQKNEEVVLRRLKKVSDYVFLSASAKYRTASLKRFPSSLTVLEKSTSEMLVQLLLKVDLLRLLGTNRIDFTLSVVISRCLGLAEEGSKFSSWIVSGYENILISLRALSFLMGGKDWVEDMGQFVASSHERSLPYPLTLSLGSPFSSVKLKSRNLRDDGEDVAADKKSLIGRRCWPGKDADPVFSALQSYKASLGTQMSSVLQWCSETICYNIKAWCHVSRAAKASTIVPSFVNVDDETLSKGAGKASMIPSLLMHVLRASLSCVPQLLPSQLSARDLGRVLALCSCVTEPLDAEKLRDGAWKCLNDIVSFHPHLFPVLLESLLSIILAVDTFWSGYGEMVSSHLLKLNLWIRHFDDTLSTEMEEDNAPKSKRTDGRRVYSKDLAAVDDAPCGLTLNDFEGHLLVLLCSYDGGVRIACLSVLDALSVDRIANYLTKSCGTTVADVSQLMDSPMNSDGVRLSSVIREMSPQIMRRCMSSAVPKDMPEQVPVSPTGVTLEDLAFEWSVMANPMKEPDPEVKKTDEPEWIGTLPHSMWSEVVVRVTKEAVQFSPDSVRQAVSCAVPQLLYSVFAVQQIMQDSEEADKAVDMFRNISCLCCAGLCLMSEHKEQVFDAVVPFLVSSKADERSAAIRALSCIPRDEAVHLMKHLEEMLMKKQHVAPMVQFLQMLHSSSLGEQDCHDVSVQSSTLMFLRDVLEKEQTRNGSSGREDLSTRILAIQSLPYLKDGMESCDKEVSQFFLQCCLSWVEYLPPKRNKEFTSLVQEKWNSLQIECSKSLASLLELHSLVINDDQQQSFLQWAEMCFSKISEADACMKRKVKWARNGLKALLINMFKFLVRRQGHSDREEAGTEVHTLRKKCRELWNMCMDRAYECESKKGLAKGYCCSLVAASCTVVAGDHDDENVRLNQVTFIDEFAKYVIPLGIYVSGCRCSSSIRRSGLQLLGVVVPQIISGETAYTEPGTLPESFLPTQEAISLELASGLSSSNIAVARRVSANDVFTEFLQRLPLLKNNFAVERILVNLLPWMQYLDMSVETRRIEVCNSLFEVTRKYGVLWPHHFEALWCGINNIQYCVEFVHSVVSSSRKNDPVVVEVCRKIALYLSRKNCRVVLDWLVPKLATSRPEFEDSSLVVLSEIVRERERARELKRHVPSILHMAVVRYLIDNIDSFQEGNDEISQMTEIGYTFSSRQSAQLTIVHIVHSLVLPVFGSEGASDELLSDAAVATQEARSQCMSLIQKVRDDDFRQAGLVQELVAELATLMELAFDSENLTDDMAPSDVDPAMKDKLQQYSVPSMWGNVSLEAASNSNHSWVDAKVLSLSIFSTLLPTLEVTMQHIIRLLDIIKMYHGNSDNDAGNEQILSSALSALELVVENKMDSHKSILFPQLIWGLVSLLHSKNVMVYGRVVKLSGQLSGQSIKLSGQSSGLLS